jgi:hydrogenase 3 maturation protease
MNRSSGHLFELVAHGGALIVGVGHPLRGDDAVGSVVATALEPCFAARVVDAGSVPESYVGPMTAVPGRPVLFVDALKRGAAPGTWCLVRAQDLGGRPADTHRPSLRLLADLLAAHDIAAWVLGIEPQHTEYGASLSEPVERTVAELTGLLASALGAPTVGVGSDA